MSDEKISQLDPVTDVLDDDDYVLARAGASKRISGASLKADLGGSSSPLRWCEVNWDYADVFTAPVTVDNAQGAILFTDIVSQDAGNTFSVDGSGDLIAAEAGWYVVGITANAPNPAGVTLAAATHQRWLEYAAILGSGPLGQQGLDALVPVSDVAVSGSVVVTGISTPGYVADGGTVLSSIPLIARSFVAGDSVTADAANGGLDQIGVWRVGT